MVFVSTSMNPRWSTRTPASSRPIPSLTGRRPIETSTWSTSIFSEPFGRLERHDDAVVGVLERADPGLGVDLRAALLQRLGQHVGAVAVGPDRQHAVRQRLQQRGVHAEVGVDGGELGPDHAAADHGDPLGQLLGGVVGRLVRGDHPHAVDVHAGDGAGHRARADDHGLAAQRLAVHRDRAVGGQRAEALDDGDLAPLEQADEAPVQLADDARLALVRRGPVRLRGAARPSRRARPRARPCGTPRPRAAAPWPGCSRGAGRCRRPSPSPPSPPSARWTRRTAPPRTRPGPPPSTTRS